MPHSRLLLTLIPLCAACGGRTAPATPVALAPCAVPGLGSGDSAWRQVRASGFTFCVPASWQPTGRGHDSVDARRWNGTGASVTWDLGQPPPVMARRDTTVTAPVARGMRGRSPSPSPSPPVGFEQPCRRRTEPIPVEGMSWLVTHIQCPRLWSLTAMSTAPAVYVQGDALTAEEADVLLRVMQTIRLSGNPH